MLIVRSGDTLGSAELMGKHRKKKEKQRHLYSGEKETATFVHLANKRQVGWQTIDKVTSKTLLGGLLNVDVVAFV